MHRTALGVTLAVLLTSILAVAVYSQESSPDQPSDQIRILQGGFSQGIPVNVTLVVPVASGMQTITVPIMLKLDLSVGPIDALDLAVEVEAPTQFVSPLRIIEPLRESPVITETITITP